MPRKSHQTTVLALALSLLLVFSLAACGGQNNGNDDKNREPALTDAPSAEAALQGAADWLDDADSFTYNLIYTEKAKNDEISYEKSTSIDMQYIKAPFVLWESTAKETRYEGEQTDTSILLEQYQAQQDDTVVLYGKSAYTDLANPSQLISGDWTKSEMGGAAAKAQAQQIQSQIDALLALLSANIEDFRPVERRTEGGATLIRYAGYFTPESIAENYGEYFRPDLVSQRYLEDAKLNTDELLKEIRGGEIASVMSGVYSLAFSQVPVPISILVDEADFRPVGFTLDRISAINGYHEAMHTMNIEYVIPEYLSESYEVVMTIDKINGVDEIPAPADLP